MNLLQRQGFFNSIILYFGTALGFFNLIILFQRNLSVEEIGFFNLMIALSMIFSQIASIGINGVILKFFPYFRTENKKHSGFATLVVYWTLASFLLFLIIFIPLKPYIITHYQGQRGVSLLVKYYNLLIPVSFLTLLFTVLESMARVIYKNVLSAFLREVLLRLFTTITVVLIAFSLISYYDFLLVYLFANLLICLVMCYSISRENQFKLGKVESSIKMRLKEFIQYGVFAVLGGGSFNLIQNMAIFMLTEFTGSLGNVGVYGTFMGIAAVIGLPARALGRTSYQIVAEAWATNDIDKIKRIYYKTSVVQSLVGSLLLIGLIVNKSTVLELLHKPEYRDEYAVFIMIALTFLVDITSGLNGQIINLSKYYRYTTYLVSIAVGFCAGLNYFLIPPFGMLGAAIAYLVTVLSLNCFYWYFIKIKFGISPFGKAHFKILIITILSLLAGWLLPIHHNFYIDTVFRSATVTILYSFMAYYLGISEDLNKVVDNLIAKFYRSKE